MDGEGDCRVSATAEVAAELGIAPNAVRPAESQVLRRLRKEVGELIA